MLDWIRNNPQAAIILAIAIAGWLYVALSDHITLGADHGTLTAIASDVTDLKQDFRDLESGQKVIENDISEIKDLVKEINGQVNRNTLEIAVIKAGK